MNKKNELGKLLTDLAELTPYVIVSTFEIHLEYPQHLNHLRLEVDKPQPISNYQYITEVIEKDGKRWDTFQQQGKYVAFSGSGWLFLKAGNNWPADMIIPRDQVELIEQTVYEEAHTKEGVRLISYLDHVAHYIGPATANISEALNSNQI